MTILTPNRIVELWPSLPDAARRELIELAEINAGSSKPLDLTSEDERLLGQARDDFKQGRTLSMDEYRADMDAFMANLRKPASPAS
jgi:hypothetical protein